MNNTERLTIDENTITIPNTIYINFDSVDNIIVKINNNEINVDKNKLETLLKTFALTKEDL